VVAAELYRDVQAEKKKRKKHSFHQSYTSKLCLAELAKMTDLQGFEIANTLRKVH
jgi:hypothetical protein